MRTVSDGHLSNAIMVSAFYRPRPHLTEGGTTSPLLASPSLPAYQSRARRPERWKDVRTSGCRVPVEFIRSGAKRGICKAPGGRCIYGHQTVRELTEITGSKRRTLLLHWQGTPMRTRTPHAGALAPTARDAPNKTNFERSKPRPDGEGRNEENELLCARAIATNCEYKKEGSDATPLGPYRYSPLRTGRRRR